MCLNPCRSQREKHCWCKFSVAPSSQAQTSQSLARDLLLRLRLRRHQRRCRLRLRLLGSAPMPGVMEVARMGVEVIACYFSRVEERHRDIARVCAWLIRHAAATSMATVRTIKIASSFAK